MSKAEEFIQLVRHPLKFPIFLLYKLPSAFFCGVRVKEITPKKTMVTVPYRWLSQNPFKSTYFACLAMAAEMSTGLLAMMNTYKSNPSVSMLVTGLEAVYHKKATGITSFICEEGDAIAGLVAQAIETGDSQSIRVHSVGYNKNNEVVAEFIFQWSFKVKDKNFT